MKTFDSNEQNNSGSQAPRGAEALQNNAAFAGGVISPTNFHRRAVPLQQASHQLARIAEQFKGFLTNTSQTANDANKDFELGVEVLDKNQYGLAISMVVVVGKTKERVLASIVMVEEGNEAYADINRQKSLPGYGNVNVATTLADLVDSDVITVIKDHLSRVYGLNQENRGKIAIVGTSAIVFNPNYSPTDNDLYQIFSGVSNGIENFAFAQAPWSIKTWRSAGWQFGSEVVYRPDVIMSANGLPIRSDAQLVSTMFQNKQTNDHNDLPPVSQANSRLLTSNVFVDVVPVKPSTDAAGNKLPQRFFPRVVLSNIASGVGYMSTEMIILAITNMLALGSNRAWAGMLFPRQSKGVNLRDVGVLNLFDDFGNSPAIDTKTLTSDQYWEMMNNLVHKDAVYSVQMDVVHELSWFYNILRQAINGDPGANNYLVDQTRNLFGEVFDKHFPAGARVMHPTTFSILTGWYNSDIGEQRPITDLDLIAMANVAGENTQTVADYLKTMYDLNTPEIVRLDMRTNMIKQIFPGVVIKGRSSIGTFSAEFVKALSATAKEIGYTPLLKNAHQQLETRHDIMFDDIRSMAVSIDSYGANDGGVVGGSINTYMPNTTFSL